MCSVFPMKSFPLWSTSSFWFESAIRRLWYSKDSCSQFDWQDSPDSCSRERSVKTMYGFWKIKSNLARLTGNSHGGSRPICRPAWKFALDRVKSTQRPKEENNREDSRCKTIMYMRPVKRNRTLKPRMLRIHMDPNRVITEICESLFFPCYPCSFPKTMRRCK